MKTRSQQQKLERFHAAWKRGDHCLNTKKHGLIEITGELLRRITFKRRFNGTTAKKLIKDSIDKGFRVRVRGTYVKYEYDVPFHDCSMLSDGDIFSLYLEVFLAAGNQKVHSVYICESNGSFDYEL